MVTIFGTSIGNDYDYSESDNDYLIYGFGGNDVIRTGSGEDDLRGGADNDHIYAGSNDDTLTGGSGIDHLRGEGGDDKYILNSGWETDYIYDTSFSIFTDNKIEFDVKLTDIIFTRFEDKLFMSRKNSLDIAVIDSYYYSDTSTNHRDWGFTAIGGSTINPYAAINTSPIVELKDGYNSVLTENPGERIELHILMDVNDINQHDIHLYKVIHKSSTSYGGYIYYNNKKIDVGTELIIKPDEYETLKYFWGSNSATDVVTVQAFDGIQWGNVESLTFTTEGASTGVPPVITSGNGSSAISFSVHENSTDPVTDVDAYDADGTSPAYSLSGGADKSSFSIDSTTGELSFISAPDFEAPTDSGIDNSYVVQVTASDGAWADTQTITVNVTDKNEPPEITSDGGGSTASVDVVEGSTVATTVAAEDLDAGAAVTYSISGGVDKARFTIDAHTGELSFVSLPDFDAPADKDGDNRYFVEVTASDGTWDDTQAITVNVTRSDDPSANDLPVITSNGGNSTATVWIDENDTHVTYVGATDPEGATLIYGISGGPDKYQFIVDTSTGKLSFASPPDFETPGDFDGDNSYVVQVRASDGSLFDEQTITVIVADVDEAPDNTAPVILDIDDHSSTVNEALEIEVRVTDFQTSPEDLTVTATTSNDTLLPLDNIEIQSISGAPTSRKLILTPVTNRTGTSDITVTVSDDELSASDSFRFTVDPTPANVSEPDHLDFPGTFATDGRVAAGGVVEGDFFGRQEYDGYIINMTAGATYDISLLLNTDEPIGNLYLKIYDSDDNLLSEGGDTTEWLKISTSFAAEVSGNYLINVAADVPFGASDVDYELKVEINEQPSGITITGDRFEENKSLPYVGEIDVIDDDDKHLFELTDDAGGRFYITNDDGFRDSVSLFGLGSFDYEEKNQYSLKLKIEDGSGNTRTETIDVYVTDVNEAPVATNLDQGHTFQSFIAQPLDFEDITVMDPDAGEQISATLVLDDVQAGRLTVSGAATYDADSGIWSATGSAADISQMLSDLSFAPADGYIGSTTVSISISDGTNPAITGQISLDHLSLSQEITRASTAADGSQSNGHVTWRPSVSENGQFVAFGSDDTNIVSGDTDYRYDVFVKNMQTGEIQRVEANSGFVGNIPVTISGDGRLVAFSSSASDLVTGDTNDVKDAFVADLISGETIRVSSSQSGVQANGTSGNPTLSGDGQLVSFHSSATNLISDDTNDASDVFVKNLQTGEVGLVSSSSTDAQGNAASYAYGYSSISDDGRFVAFMSYASNLVSGDTNNEEDLFVKDLVTGNVQRVTTTESSGQVSNPNAISATISADGRFVVFESYSSEFVVGDTNGKTDVFVKDLLTGTISRANRPADGSESVGSAFDARISGDGRYVVFRSIADDLIENDNNDSWNTYVNDIFVKDMITGEIVRVNVSSSRLEQTTSGTNVNISADGRYIVFNSGSDQLVSNDNNGKSDTFFTPNPLAALNVDELSEFDFPASSDTPGQITVGGAVTGTIESAGDTDGFNVKLQAGMTYKFALYGTESGFGSLGNPVIRLLNSDMTEVGRNDNGGDGLESLLNFTPGTTGTYLVLVDGYSSNTGSYRLTVSTNTAPAGGPTIDGTVSENQTLEADISGISDADGIGAISYQWLRDGVDVSNATGSTYKLGNGDVGARISVKVSYTDGNGTLEGPLTSSKTAVVANVNDAPTGKPTITGTIAEDQTITADTSAILDDDGLGTFSHQWLRDGVDISNATGSTYKLGNADVGARISVEVRYTDGNGTEEGPLTSLQTGVISNVNDAPSGTPKITGTPTDDQTITADTSGISDDDGVGAFSYKWLRDGVEISNAIGSAYKLGDGDVGARFSVKVSYVDGNGTLEGPLTSLHTEVVSDANDAPSGGPEITGTATEKEILQVAQGTLEDADGLGALSYHWQRSSDGVSFTDVIGATKASYTLTAVDVGKQVRAVASYTDSGGASESAASNPSVIVVAADPAPVFTEGNDVVTLTIGGVYAALGGNDHVTGSLQADNVSGGLGNDTVKGGNGNDTVKGNNGNDKLFGGNNTDKLTGGSGKDTLLGDAGKDQLNGGSQNDKLQGGDQNDVLRGNAGNDQLFGGKHNDKLFGGSGKDQLRGDQGNDRIVGGADTDTAVYAGKIGGYKIVKAGSRIKVIDKDGKFGTDILTGVEKLKFGGTVYSVKKALKLVAQRPVKADDDGLDATGSGGSSGSGNTETVFDLYRIDPSELSIDTLAFWADDLLV